MSDGLALSLGAAVALGASSLALAVAARRVGTVPATAATLVLALGPLVALAAVRHASFAVAGRPALVLLCAGGLVALAYLATIESLRLGPVAVTSPIASSAGAGTVVAAFVVLGERPSAGQWAGVLVTAAGVVLASVRRDGSALHLAGLGPVFGAAGVVLGSVANAIVRDPVRELGPLPAIVTQRTFTIVVVALVVAVALWRSPRLRAAVRRSATRAPIDRRLLALLGLLGLLDALAFLAFAYALLDAPAWLVGLVSQSGRALAVVGGVVLFHERLDRIQWTGVATLGAGLVVLSVFSAGI